MVPGLGIDPDFTVRDQAAFIFVNILNRVFHGNDVTSRIGIAVIDHRRQRGRFTGTGTAHHQHQTTLNHDHVF